MAGVIIKMITRNWTDVEIGNELKRCLKNADDLTVSHVFFFESREYFGDDNYQRFYLWMDDHENLVPHGIWGRALIDKLADALIAGEVEPFNSDMYGRVEQKRRDLLSPSKHNFSFFNDNGEIVANEEIANKHLRVGELVTELLKMPQDLLVWCEGCDCLGAAGKPTIEKDEFEYVLISRQAAEIDFD